MISIMKVLFILFMLFSSLIHSQELIPLEKYVERHQDSIGTDPSVLLYLTTRCASLNSFYSALTTLSNNKKSKEVSEGKQKSYMKFASLSIQLFQKIRPDADAEKKVIEQIMEIVTEYKSIAEKNYTTQGTYIIGILKTDAIACKDIEEGLFSL